MSQVSQRNALPLAIVSIVLAAFGAYLGIDPKGVPAREQLRNAAGTVTWAQKDRHMLVFSIDSMESATFAYHSKAGSMSAVQSDIARGKREGVAVLFDPEDRMGPVWRDDGAFPVYQLKVAGRTIRSLEDVDRAWRSDNRVWLYMAVIAALSAIYFALLSFRRRHRVQ